MKTSSLLAALALFLALAIVIWARERIASHCESKPGNPGCFILGPVE